MNKKKRYKKAIAACSALIMGTTTVLSAMGAPVVAAEEQKERGQIGVNPDIHYQTLEGWGTSLCWWGNIIGSWKDADWNKNGRADREEIAELAFSPEYLNLNIVRYNVGGGDKEDSSIARCEGLVPGWTEDMTGSRDASQGFDGAAFYSKKTEEMSDAGQLWMLEQANRYRHEYAQQAGGTNDVINMVFSNSPPYYMTKSGTSTGGNYWDLNNLKEDCYDDFAMYLAKAVKWVDQNLETKFGTGVSYAEPLNEPDTSYWQAGSTKQEGCIFNTGELQSRAYREMEKALNGEEFGGSLEDIRLTGTDETALWNTINSFNRLDEDVKANLETISAHTYSGNNAERRELNNIARSYDKGLWMSEVTRGGGSHYEGCHESMDAANTRSQSEGIMADLKYMKPSAWMAWLVADSEYECLQTNSNWGLIHAVFEKDGQPAAGYHTNLLDENGNRKDWVPGEGYWAVTKQFYTMMQYSKYLKAGYTMIDIQDSNMCAAISPMGDELVIVAQNFGGEKKTSIDLGAFSGAESAELYRTSDEEACELVETQDVTDGVMEVSLPSNSVSTYVVRANDKSAICSTENYGEIVSADVENPSVDWTSNLNKFSYEGAWGESSEEFGEGKYTTAEEGAVTFTFQGNQAMLYGSKAPEGALVNISVDQNESFEVSLKAEKKDGEALIYNTGSLGDGIHTVTISKAKGQGDRLLEMNYAKLVRGTLEEKIERFEKVPTAHTVSNVLPELPKTVYGVTNMGNRKKVEVKWNLEGEDFTKNTTLTGTTEESSLKVFMDVRVVLENVQYFIDCNSPNSPEYARVNQYAELNNDSPDQKYTENGWGYVEEYGAYNGNKEDSYDTGWYAYNNQSIRYKLPLTSGRYKISMGFKEWWNQDRPMNISITCANNTSALGKANTWKNGNPWNQESYEFVCESTGEATFTISSDQGPAPVLSFIRIQKVLDLQLLKDVLSRAAEVDRDRYTEGELEALDKAVSTARGLLFKGMTTQQEIEKAAADIEKEVQALNGTSDPEETDKNSLKLAIAMAYKLEQEQRENSCYTSESWIRVQECLIRAEALLENPLAGQEEIDRVFLELITVCNLLENSVQKAGLKAVIEGAKAILEDESGLTAYTAESIEAVRNALTEAQRVYAEGEVDQETINKASRKLMDAVTSLLLKEKPARLIILIKKAEELLQSRDLYTPSSIANLENVLEAAKQAADNAQATEAQISQAYNKLAEAMTSLVRKADKAELKNALDKANEILKNSQNYLEESISGLREITDLAQTVHDSAEADTEKTGEALKKLVEAILKVRLLGDVNFDGTADSEDSAEVLKHAAEFKELTTEQSRAADVNKDQKADSEDAAIILQYASEKIQFFK